MRWGNQKMGTFVKEKLPDPLSFYQGRGLVLQPGKEWRSTSCEFHISRTTMRINMNSGGFVCMAQCGAKGGSVVDYYMAINGVDFYTAAKALGAIEADGKPYKGPKRPLRIPTHDLLKLVPKELYICSTVVSALSNALIDNPELEEALAPKINFTDLQSFFEAAGKVIYVSEISNA
jgi:hypothetical protein